MSIASQESARSKVVAGALLLIAKDCGVKNNRGQPEAPATQQRANIGNFGDADKGSAKAEGVSNNGDEKRQFQRKYGSSRQGSKENIVAVAPQRFGQAEKPRGRQSA